MSYNQWMNLATFFLVRDGLGPYLPIYLTAEHNLAPSAIGLILSIAGFSNLMFQPLAGAFIDRTGKPRDVIVYACLTVATYTLALPFIRSVPMLCVLQAVAGATAGVFGPAMAAMTLSITGSGAAFGERIGKNEMYDHVGNAIAAMLAGVFSAWHSLAVFRLMAFNAACAMICVYFIPIKQTHKETKKNSQNDKTDAVKSKKGLLRTLGSGNSPLLLFAFCLAIFHLANAAILPLVGQKLATVQGTEYATMLTSSCIVGAQFVMAAVSHFVGAKADSWGRRPLLLIGFAALPLRAFLLSVSSNMYWMLGVQLLDGLGPGVLDTLLPLMVRDVVGDSGDTSFGASLGAIATIQGIGATLSNPLAGVVMEYDGFDTTFRVLGCVALVALMLVALKMPETKKTKGN